MTTTRQHDMTSVPRVVSVKAELRSDSPWVAVNTPRLSWVVAPAADWRQAWADLRDGEREIRVEGRDSVLVPWPFRPLEPGEQRHVSVRVGSDDGRESEWSDDLLIASAQVREWAAHAITHPHPDAPARPALFRHEIRLDRPVRRAVLHSSALGLAEFRLNGSAITDDVLSPGWTSYQLRVIYDSADVTARLRDGANVLAARLAGGWFTEEYNLLNRPRRFYGEQPRLLAQLDVEYEDGTRATFGTGPEWRTIADPETKSSGIYAGEVADLRGALHGWDAPGFDDASWSVAVIAPDAVPTPEPRISPPARRAEFRRAVAVLRSPDGAPILDFGQNLVGRVRIRVSGTEGDRVILRHAEVLDETGDVALRPLRRATARDEVVLTGRGIDEWEPRFTFHGFRYLRVDGWPGELDPDAIEAVVIETAMERVGWFDSSEPLLNRLHENVMWTMRGNYIHVPMDCPQRDERFGWTGDTQLFAPTAAFLFDCEAFLLSWMRDLALEQTRAGGVVPLFAPDILPNIADRSAMPAWGDAITIIPAVLERATGDARLREEFYPAMVAWAERIVEALEPDGRWEAGRQLGDWLDPNAPPNAPARGRTDPEIVGTAYAFRSFSLTATTAEKLGKPEDAQRYTTLAERSRRAFGKCQGG